MIRLVLVIGCGCFCHFSFGQGRPATGQAADTTKLPAQAHDTTRHWWKNNIFQFFRNTITKGKPDSVIDINSLEPLNTKSESPFRPYEGKVIRHIYIRGYGFEQTFPDTSRRLEYFGTQLLNSLHRKTRDWVIRDALFIRENMPVNAYMLADNERLIRNLNYIQDARILVNRLPESPDSVDIVVVVKDLFSISGAIGALGYPPFSLRADASEANFLGMGQRIQGGMNLEQARNPNFGGQLLYSKTYVGHSFTNVTAAYTQINSNIYSGTPDETAWFVQIDRPLYAPYAHLAGGLRVGDFQNYNVYKQPDSLFYKYHYHTRDGWLGWNIGSNHFVSNTAVLDRRFVALRYFRNDFDSVPKQVGNSFNFRFNSREAALSSFTFFRQEFYKTNYIYGFGTTEDIPKGYNIAFTGGWYRQLQVNRLYTGIDANGYTVSNRGAFAQFFFRSGLFLGQGKPQDASFLLGASYYSPLYVFDRLKIRQYLNFSFTRLINRVGLDYLTINNVFGLRYFTNDSTSGVQRVTMHSETTFFLNGKILGFKFAPFAFGDLSFLTPQNGSLVKSDLYDGVGAGIRTRNENLIFNTIEFRMVYFPRKAEYNNSFKILINTGIQFRYNSSYVHQPDVVFLNTDGLNSIY